ncbi:hypothetical protein JAAARDRAFT_350988 [Jaapia argillacea MUCL 33604]|uniref:F-box domain-containing protein n=1 Tax=Jaapia argillacea MUCL 33604 TaxID=933084 RepID=A0A067PIV1_9AGAM|nr:hypothetical protein JAAARDRAFT_350988 [Jaapia argillacea MUCL 33604]
MIAAAPISSPSVLPIPCEVTEQALTFCHPRDVASFAGTCRSARNLVYQTPDQYLWRQLFLAHFDDPRKALSVKREDSCRLDWKAELQKRIRAEFVAYNAEERALDRYRALATFIAVIEGAAPVEEGHEHTVSLNLKWLDHVLRDSRVLDTAVWHPERAMRALLRSYLALTHDDRKDDEAGKRLKLMRTSSRCFVYDLRKYSRETFWGPYEPQNSVNWKHVENNINVIIMNLRELPDMWLNTRPPCGLESTRAYSAPGSFARSPRDWAGVEGNWRRFVCFMDYRDLFAFNFSAHNNGPRHPSFFEDENFQEATRLVETTFRVIEDDAEDEEFSFVGHPANCQADQPSHPAPIHFVGLSHGSHGNEATVKGCVKMFGDRIRWRWVSIYDHHTQWSSDGVQLGQVCSAAGVVGNWTGAYHEEGDPAGPFWLWKVPDEHPSHLSEFTDD